MPVLEYAGRCIEVDEAGYLLDGDEWTPEIAEAMAMHKGLSQLTEQHWKLIALCREEAAGGPRPRMSRLSEISGVSSEVLRSLFGASAASLLPALAGLPGPLAEES